LGFGIAQAAIPDSSGVIHACYNKLTGTLRVISSSASVPRLTGVAGDGKTIICELESERYHWHPVS